MATGHLTTCNVAEALAALNAGLRFAGITESDRRQMRDAVEALTKAVNARDVDALGAIEAPALRYWSPPGEPGTTDKSGMLTGSWQLLLRRLQECLKAEPE